MDVAVTVRAVPTCLSGNVAVPLTVRESPEMRSSAYVTVALAEPLYVRSAEVIVTSSDFAVMAAVAVGAPERLSV